MRKLLVSVAIATATLAAVPAAAQYRDHHPGWNQRGPSRPAVNNLLRQLDNVDVRITRSMQRRVISQREAVSLRRESNQIRSRLRIAARNGLSGRECWTRIVREFIDRADPNGLPIACMDADPRQPFRLSSR